MPGQEEEVPSALLTEGPCDNPARLPGCSEPIVSVSNTKAPGKAEGAWESSASQASLSFHRPTYQAVSLQVTQGHAHSTMRCHRKGRGPLSVGGPVGGQPGHHRGLWTDKQDQTTSHKLSRDKLPCLETKGHHTPGSQHRGCCQLSHKSPCPPPPCISGRNLGSVQFENNNFCKNENHLTGQAKLSGPRTL